MDVPTPNEFAAKSGYRPFPPRWERWLSAARAAILAAQPIPGRNTAVDVHPGKGTVINIFDTSSRRIVPPPPPTGCLPPEGPCSQAISFELMLDTGDTSNQDIFDLQTDANAGLLGMWFESGNWNIYSFDSGITAVAAISPYDTWHSFCFQLFMDAADVKCHFTIDGLSGTDFTVITGANVAANMVSNIEFGAQYGVGAKHRSIRNIAISGDSLPSFSLPPGPFDSLTGPGISIAGDGSLRIDDDTDADNFGRKDFAADRLDCCHATLVCDTISAIASACGFAPFENGGIFYTTLDFPNCGLGTVNYSGVVDSASKWFYQTSVQVGCTPDPPLSCCGVSGTVTTIEIQNQELCNGTAQVDSQSGSFTIVEGPDPCPPQSPDCDGCPGQTLGINTLACVTQTITLTEEITDDTLCSIAAGRLPPYPGSWDGLCFASRDVNTATDPHSCTIQRFKYKFTFPSPPDNGLKLCWNEHFVPDLGDPVDTPRSFTFDGIVSETSVLEVVEPDTDGEVTITDVVCNCP